MQSFDKKSKAAIKKSDVSIAKNYLTEDEMKLLGLLVEQYLAFAETMAQQRTPMYMADWITRLDSLLQLNGRELLTHAGKITHEQALEKSGEEFEKYRLGQAEIEKDSEEFFHQLHSKFLQMPALNKNENDLETHFDKWCFFLKNL